MEPLFDTSFVLSSPIYMSHNATRDLLFSMGAPSSWKMMDALLQWLSILVLSCLHGFAISLHHIQASKLDIKDKKSWRLWRKNLEEKFSCFPSGLFSQRERLKVLHSRTLLSYWITTFNYLSKSIFFWEFLIQRVFAKICNLFPCNFHTILCLSLSQFI